MRALGHVLQADRNVSKGIIATTSDFAPRIVEDPFIKPYLPHRIELINGQRLLERFQERASIEQGSSRVLAFSASGDLRLH
jgi:restriction system protein